MLNNSDNAFCLTLLKNDISELERQIIEKDAVINFLSNQLVNKNLNGYYGVNKMTLIVHAGTNDLTKNIDTLRSVKKLCKKAKRISPDTKNVFSNVIYRNDRRNTDKQRTDTNARLKNFCHQKNIPLIDNGNIKEEQLGLKCCT